MGTYDIEPSTVGKPFQKAFQWYQARWQNFPWCWKQVAYSLRKINTNHWNLDEIFKIFAAQKAKRQKQQIKTKNYKWAKTIGGPRPLKKCSPCERIADFELFSFKDLTHFSFMWCILCTERPEPRNPRSAHLSDTYAEIQLKRKMS